MKTYRCPACRGTLERAPRRWRDHVLIKSYCSSTGRMVTIKRVLR